MLYALFLIFFNAQQNYSKRSITVML